MRYADTPTLLHLNDRAKLLDLPQWLKARFFDDVDPDGIHVLAYAFPHGIRPGSSPLAAKAPPHYRTAWYAAMRDGTDEIIFLDVERDEYDALPVIDGAPDELVGQTDEEGKFELPAVIVLDNVVIDGRHVAAAAREVGAATIPALHLPPLTGDQLAELRRGIG